MPLRDLASQLGPSATAAFAGASIGALLGLATATWARVETGAGIGALMVVGFMAGSVLGLTTALLWRAPMRRRRRALTSDDPKPESSNSCSTSQEGG